MNAHPVSIAAPVAMTAHESDRLAHLFDAHQHTLYRLARRLAPVGTEAGDLVQEVFLRAVRNPRRVPADRTGEEAWLVRILINICRDEWRRRSVRMLARPVLVAPGHVNPTQERDVAAREQIWAALDRLPPRRRAVIVLHELDGAPIHHIAALLGIGAVTVRWHLARGRRELKRVLDQMTGETR